MKKVTVTRSVIPSAAVTASHTPSIPRITGSSRTTAIWNTKVLKKEIAADTAPSLRAVKKEEAKILKPQIKNDIDRKSVV